MSLAYPFFVRCASSAPVGTWPPARVFEGVLPMYFPSSFIMAAVRTDYLEWLIVNSLSGLLRLCDVTFLCLRVNVGLRISRGRSGCRMHRFAGTFQILSLATNMGGQNRIQGGEFAELLESLLKTPVSIISPNTS